MAGEKHVIFEEKASSLKSDGRRNFVHPADVKGIFTLYRKLFFALLLFIYVALPWIQINGAPAVFIDIAARRFFLFGLSFNAQDTWLLFFLLSGIGFFLFVATALFGRVWCGYACPQTVFLEGVFRQVERIIEGPRAQRMRRNAGPWNFDKAWRKILKHFLFVGLAAVVAHVFLSYFVSLPRLFEMMAESPADHVTAFLWVTVLTGVIYFNFAWFREQLCLIICPYGRLQSVMTDYDTIVIGYDEKRGEPRTKGKKKKEGAGDCVDCGRCTAVCPTGIDIRNGLQIDCIGCAACVDACNEIMAKLGRDKGLVRYDSLRGLQEGKRQFWRPRLALYGILAVVGLVVAIWGVSSRGSFEASLLRMGNTPYVAEPDGRVQNLFELHVVNKENETKIFEIVPLDEEFYEYVIAMPELDLKGGKGMRVPVFVYSREGKKTDRVTLEVRVKGSEDPPPKKVSAPFLRPH